ncbi:MAG TPA: PAS domain-containing sensor histidine kinase [Magnetospirillaceae bacterium]|nr:PAS domain-containing sensor histidine kinase [Magnetospirillaceae bacterium]
MLIDLQDPAAPAIGAALLMLLIFMPIIVWLRRELRQAQRDTDGRSADHARLEEVLSTAPDGFFRWALDDDGRITDEQCSRRLAVLLGLYGGMAARFDDVLACFGESDSARLDSYRRRLHEEGEAFDLELPLREGTRRILVVGCRAASPEGTPLADVLWLRDVTEGAAAVARLEAEKTDLDRERDRLRALLDGLPLPVWLRDGDLTPVACNRAYAGAVDMDGPGEAIESGAELVPASAVREARALAARARASGLPRSAAFHLVMGGARRLADLTETPIVTNEGLFTVGMAIDQTKQEELQNQLERHIAAHAEVLENLGTAIAIFGSDSKLAFFNTAFSVLWRLDPDWLNTQPTYGNLLDSLREHRRLPEAADFRAFKEEELRRFTSLLEAREDLLHLPDERTLRRLISAHPFGGLLFTYEDVTDALALERSHKTSLAVHRETLDNLHEGVAVFSSDGRLRLSNPAYGRIWNMSVEALAGEPHITDLIAHHRPLFATAGDWPAVQEGMLALFAERIPRHGRIERSDGAILDYASVPLPDGAVLNTWMDVSDSAHVERALRERNDALATADRLKSEFIANVSAEVKTPLATVLAYSEMLANEHFGTLSPRQRDYATGITDAGQHLQQVLSDILDLATIEAGQMTLQLNAVDVHAMLTGVLGLARERVRQKQITMDFLCPLEIGWMVADERRIRQVLFNLLSNAVKSTPKGGTITFAAEREPGPDGDSIAFTVSDSGQGGAPAVQERMFASFVRADLKEIEEGSRNSNGTGLGLTLVKRFVELHGGRVGLRSVEGEGTTVTLHVPAGGIAK